MKHGLRFSLAVFFSLPAFAGDGGHSSAKGGLEPLTVPESSAKGGLDLFPPISAKSKSRWSLGVGVSLRKIGRIDFDTGASRFGVPRLFGDSYFNQPPGIGLVSGFEAREYDDGFVRPELRTAATGRTTFYEYDSADQIRDGYLLMSADGGERSVVSPPSTNLQDTSWTEDDDWEISPFLTLSRMTPIGNRWSVGPSFHFSFTNVNGGQQGLGTLIEREQRDLFDVRAFDRFDTTGLILPRPVPPLPFTGSPGASLPLLPAEPNYLADPSLGRTFEDTLRSTDLALFNDSIQESLDVNLFGFSVGADAFYQDVDGFFFGLGAGVVLNVADWNARRSDRLLQITNGGAPVEINTAEFRASGTDVLFGAYLQGAVGVRVSDSISVQANLRYDWNESLRNSVGDSDFDVDLSGLSMGLSVTYFF
ncbi:MAG: hypothetical protein ACON4R_07510 [Akkermansiaceae bacterium]